MIKVLSIDGGGVRGIIPARILQEIELRTGKHISQLFDIVSGTSTGGLLALGITKPNESGKPAFSAKDLVNLYINRSKEIFKKRSIVGKICTGFGLWGSKYDRTAYDAVLQECFGYTLLSQTLCPVFIPIYSLENDKPFISGTCFALANPENNFYLRDIAGATSAAPTYFDPKVFKNLNATTTYQGVDGGIYANNPELIGVTGVYIFHPNCEVGNIILLSLGTGDIVKNINNNRNNNGIIGWLKNKDIIGDMMDAESVVAETAITAMLRQCNHFRFQLQIAQGLAAMDNSSDSNLTALLQAAENFIQQNNDSINNLCKRLV